MRTLIGFLVAPIAPVFAYTLFSFFPSIVEAPLIQFPYLAAFLLEALAVAYGLSLVAGVPALAVLKRQGRFDQYNTVSVAAAIAAGVPVALELYRLTATEAGVKYSYTAEGCHAIVENVRTKCGYMLMLKEMIVLAIVGAAVGLVFWYLRRPPEHRAG